MRLLVPPRTRLLWDLLLLTLLLGAVCGMQKKLQRPGAQPRNPVRKAQGDTGMGEQQSPDPGDSVTNVSSDLYTCEKWVSCNSDFYKKYLTLVWNDLPSCPCTYPAEALDGVVRLFDERLGRFFSWKDASDAGEHVDAYLPTARLCLRSLRGEKSSTLASQLCCYNNRSRLLTRGKGARGPELINPDLYPKLHFIVDHTPWESCKGDWRILHKLLPPNNGLFCPDRPSKTKFESQWKELGKK